MMVLSWRKLEIEIAMVTSDEDVLYFPILDAIIAKFQNKFGNKNLGVNVNSSVLPSCIFSLSWGWTFNASGYDVQFG